MVNRRPLRSTGSYDGTERFFSLLDGVQAKIEAIAKEMYGASGVEFLPQAEKMIAEYEKLGCDKLPICMAKTQYSFTSDASKKGAPSGFTLPVRDLKVSLGAGFLVAYVGDIMLMPGLPTRPAFYEVCQLPPVAARHICAATPDVPMKADDG